MVAVVGMGFVGLTTALGIAHTCSCDVYGYDIDPIKNKAIDEGKIPFFEPGLQEKLNEYRHKTFHVCKSMDEAVKNSEIIFLCIGTPGNEDGSANLQMLKSAVDACLNCMNSFKVIVIKSTIPPSTTTDIIKPYIKNKGYTPGIDVGLANNPEFLREGCALEDFLHPDRIIIGECDKRSGDLLEKLYSSFETPVIRVSAATAEFCKYLSNTLLAAMISFSNEMAMAADAIGGIDIQNSFKILHMDKRWFGAPAKMTSYIYPGCGFGGYCLPKDTMAMKNILARKKYESGLLKEVLEINSKVIEYTVQKIINQCNPDDCIGILGLSFKPDSDDIRNTPTSHIIKSLIDKGYENIIAYDPMSMEKFHQFYNLPIKYAETMEEVVGTSSVIAVLTAWREFLEKKSIMENHNIVDARYIL